MAEFVLDRVEKNLGKGENTRSLVLYPFPKKFARASFLMVVKTWVVWYRAKIYQVYSSVYSLQM